MMSMQNEKMTYPLKSVSTVVSGFTTIAQMIASEFPSFNEIRVTINYYPALKHLKMAMSVTPIYVMLNMGLQYYANIAVITNRLVDEYFEVAVAVNGEPWNMKTVDEMEESLRSEYKHKVNINSTKKTKWHFRPISLLIHAHQMCGCFGVRQVGDGTNASIVNKEFFYKFALDNTNPGFNFTKWRQKNKNKKTETREWIFESTNN